MDDMQRARDILKQGITKDLENALKKLGAYYSKYNEKNPHNVGTPDRIARMWIDMFRGLDEPTFEFTTFPNDCELPSWIIKRDIEFSSMCQHHFMPFYGTIDIGYIPKKKMAGISKLDRAVDYVSKRPQVQEKLGEELLHFLYINLQPEKIAVRIKSTHTCVACRGAESRNSEMVTFHAYSPSVLKDFLGLL